ncbi:hypothetical protein PF008_g6327 [Phytophthora fragariae]|uniref:Uncharacterized protein n=1 Tax=Phytophthora fragariae TaxID=53985 RepID=A0A6G0S5Y9_9STRA|nr:hypothetical protein PF008_g6327 [Phytophthora fragariae]
MLNEMAAYDPIEHDYDDVNQEAENQEVEAGAQQATSGIAARDEESALSPEHDSYEEEQDAEACARQSASVNEACDARSALEPDDEYDVETVAEEYTPLNASVTTTPDERPATEAKPDGSVSAVLRVVYQLVKAEEQLGAESCHSFSSPLSPRLDERKEPKADDSPKDCDLAVRARSVIKRSVTTKDEQLIGKLMNEVVDAYTANATLIQSKVVRMSFDCSSLFSTRSEAFGSNGSRPDREVGVFEYVYVPKPNDQADDDPDIEKSPDSPRPTTLPLAPSQTESG